MSADASPTVVVTGAGGFLGTHLLRHLRATRPAARLFGVVRALPAIRVPDVAYGSDLPKADLIFHLAGSAAIDRSIDDPCRDLEVNALAALRMLEEARGMPGVRIVLASSAAVYGRVRGVVDETHALDPISPYGVSKLAAEGYARTYVHLHGLSCSIARIANPYGPLQRRLVIYEMARQATTGGGIELRGSGDEVRDFIHATDVARALDYIAIAGAPGEAYNVGSGRATTLRDLAAMVARAAGLPHGSIRMGASADAGTVDEFRPSLAKLTRLGFRAEIALDAGIEGTVNWVRQG